MKTNFVSHVNSNIYLYKDLDMHMDLDTQIQMQILLNVQGQVDLGIRIETGIEMIKRDRDREREKGRDRGGDRARRREGIETDIGRQRMSAISDYQGLSYCLVLISPFPVTSNQIVLLLWAVITCVFHQNELTHEGGTFFCMWGNNWQKR